MNFGDDEDDPDIFEISQVRARFEELNKVVIRNLPSIQNIDEETDISDEPARCLTEAEIRASCTSLYSSLNLSDSGSVENKSEKKELDNDNESNNVIITDVIAGSTSREPFFDVPDNLDEILDAKYGTNFTKNKNINKQNSEANLSLFTTLPCQEENGNSTEIDENFNVACEGMSREANSKNEAGIKLKSEPKSKTLDECIAAQGDGHQFGTRREDVVFAQLTKMVSATCGEHLNPITGEGIVLEEGDCGSHKLAAPSGSRPVICEESWKRGSASTSTCGRPATVPRARMRRSENITATTKIDCEIRESGKEVKDDDDYDDDDEDSGSDDNSWWEDDDNACVPKRRESSLKGSANVDITRQRSILDLCSVEHGETVMIEPAINLDCPDPNALVPASVETQDESSDVLNRTGSTGGEQSVDLVDASFDGDSEVIYDYKELDRGETWDWVSAIPRACFLEEIELQRENCLPLLCNVREGEIDQRLLHQRLQVSRGNWN